MGTTYDQGSVDDAQCVRRRDRVRRRIVRVFVAVMLGLVLNVGVPYVPLPASLRKPSFVAVSTTKSGGVHWVVQREEAITTSSVTSMASTPERVRTIELAFLDVANAQSWGDLGPPDWCAIDGIDAEPFRMTGGEFNLAVSGTAFGWPFRSMKFTIVSGTINGAPHIEVRGALQIGLRGFAISPLWPGFLANTAIYGGLVYGVLTLVAIGRVRWRVRRGRCGHCGYARTGLTPESPCPECAEPV